jgi:hypothetical protein
VDLQEILQIPLVFDVGAVVRNLIFDDFGEIFSAKSHIMLSEVLMVVTFLHHMSLFLDRRRVRRKEAQSKVRVIHTIFIFEIFIDKVIALDILLESFADCQCFVHIVTELPAVNEQSKGDIRFSLEGVLDDRSHSLLCSVVTVLEEDDGYVSILIDDQVELKLRISLVEGVELYERSS